MLKNNMHNVNETYSARSSQASAESGGGKIPLKRRMLLGAVGASIGTTGLNFGAIDVVSADDPEIDHGEIQFFEIILEHTNVPNGSYMMSCDMVNYHLEDQRLFLLHPSPDPFEDNDGVITDGLAYQPLPTTMFGGEADYVPVETWYRQHNVKSLVAAEPYPLPEIECSFNSRELLLEADGEEYALLNGEEARIEMDERSIVTLDTNSGEIEPKAITPRVSARSHGQVRVFGRDDAIVLPAESSVHSMDMLINHILESEHIQHESYEEDDLLLIPKTEMMN